MNNNNKKKYIKNDMYENIKKITIYKNKTQFGSAIALPYNTIRILIVIYLEKACIHIENVQ
jgi:hypothetical protein